MLACLTRFQEIWQLDADPVKEMVKLAFGYDAKSAERYLREMNAQIVLN